MVDVNYSSNGFTFFKNGSSYQLAVDENRDGVLNRSYTNKPPLPGFPNEEAYNLSDFISKQPGIYDKNKDGAINAGDGAALSQMAFVNQNGDLTTAAALGITSMNLAPGVDGFYSQVANINFADGSATQGNGAQVQYKNLYEKGARFLPMTGQLPEATRISARDFRNENDPNVMLDVNAYLDANPDLKAAFAPGGVVNAQGALDHYNNTGYREPRPGVQAFNLNEYLAGSADLAGFGGNIQAARQHYLSNGANEHRPVGQPVLLEVDQRVGSISKQDLVNGKNSNVMLDVNAYLDANPDLKAAFAPGGVVNAQAAIDHYKTFGYKEPRPGVKAFNLDQYLSSPANTDLRSALHYDTAQARQHYLASGANEHRQTGPAVTVTG